MTFRSCFNCFKRNHGKYDIPLNNSSCVVFTSQSSSKQPNKNLSNSGPDTSQRTLTTLICDDHSDLYAAIDKTKQAKNAIRIKPDTYQHSRTRSTYISERSKKTITSSNSYPDDSIHLSSTISSSDPGYATVNNPINKSDKPNSKPSHRTPHLYINTDQSHTTNHQSIITYQNISFPNNIDDDSSDRYATIGDFNSINKQITNN